MKGVSSPISPTGSRLEDTRHIRAFFNNGEEEYRILLPFMNNGLKANDKAVRVLNCGRHAGRISSPAAA